MSLSLKHYAIVCEVSSHKEGFLNKKNNTRSFTLKPTNNKQLAATCGQLDENLRQIESHLGIEINNRGHDFDIIGDPKAIKYTQAVIEQLFKEAKEEEISPTKVGLVLQNTINQLAESKKALSNQTLKTPRLTIKPRSVNQDHYLTSIDTLDVNFAVGPAGTGKTYLAVAAAVAALTKEQVRKIILVRPAVEAGERLGFLPGDLAQKVDPYLRPLYDALFDMLGVETVNRLIEKNVIEVAPLAYMRGRTLNDAFIILDESQNTTPQQMKMFLTRIGFNSKAVITGDITQIDLPPHSKSGLRHVIQVLKDIEGIAFTFFQAFDVVRHPLVQRMIQAYEQAERNT